MNARCYAVHGLILTSTLPLPELEPGEGKVDVCIDIVQMEGAASRDYAPISCLEASPNRVHLTWGGVGDLLIEEGRRITIIPCPDAEGDALRLFVLGAGLGVLLHQRGLLVLHASGVAIHHRVVGFIGAKGWGKSTTAAALHQRGYALIADELLVVRFNAQNQPLVIPGSPQIKLWSDALINTGGDPDSTSRIRSGIDKFSVRTMNTAPGELFLHCLYLLSGGETLSIQSMSPSQVFFSLVPHLYVCRFGTQFLQLVDPARLFRQLDLLVKSSAVKRLSRPRDLNQLPDIADLIERDVFSGAPAC